MMIVMIVLANYVNKVNINYPNLAFCICVLDLIGSRNTLRFVKTN